MSARLRPRGWWRARPWIAGLAIIAGVGIIAWAVADHVALQQRQDVLAQQLCDLLGGKPTPTGCTGAKAPPSHGDVHLNAGLIAQLRGELDALCRAEGGKAAGFTCIGVATTRPSSPTPTSSKSSGHQPPAARSTTAPTSTPASPPPLAPTPLGGPSATPTTGTPCPLPLPICPPLTCGTCVPGPGVDFRGRGSRQQ
jgi:hypothetical protein